MHEIVLKQLGKDHRITKVANPHAGKSPGRKDVHEEVAVMLDKIIARNG